MQYYIKLINSDGQEVYMDYEKIESIEGDPDSPGDSIITMNSAAFHLIPNISPGDLFSQLQQAVDHINKGIQFRSN